MINRDYIQKVRDIVMMRHPRCADASDLNCGCAVCSALLVKLLKQFKGFDPVLHTGFFDMSDHAWVVVNGEWIVDITASQFGMEDVVIEPIDSEIGSRYEVEFVGVDAEEEVYEWREQSPMSVENEEWIDKMVDIINFLTEND